MMWRGETGGNWFKEFYLYTLYLRFSADLCRVNQFSIHFLLILYFTKAFIDHWIHWTLQDCEFVDFLCLMIVIQTELLDDVKICPNFPQHLSSNLLSRVIYSRSLDSWPKIMLRQTFYRESLALTDALSGQNKVITDRCSLFGQKSCKLWS